MYGRVWRVMRIPQIMGWWGIVLIQQANAAETELPFWRKGRRQLFPEYRPRSNGSWGGWPDNVFLRCGGHHRLDG